MTGETNMNEEYMGYTPGGGGNKFEMLPEGSYDFVIHGVVGLGLRPHSYEGKELNPQAVVKIIFEIPEHKREDGKTELLTIKLPVSSNEKSHYFKFCTALFGQNVTGVKENMEKLVYSSGMRTLLGKVGTLSVVTWKNGEGRSVSNKGFYPLHPKAPKPEATREFVFFNPFSPDIEVFKNNLTSWTRKEIMEALNADNFSDELKLAYKECLVEDAKKKAEKNSVVRDSQTTQTDSAPWDTSNSTEAIQ